MSDLLREEIRKHLDDGPFDHKRALEIARIAESAADFMRARSTLNAQGLLKPSSTDNDYGPDFVSQGPSPFNQETQAARLVRELVASLPELMRMQRETPQSLVAAIAEAKEHGLVDVARQLEERLTGKALTAAAAPAAEVATVAPQSTAEAAGLSPVVFECTDEEVAG